MPLLLLIQKIQSIPFSSIMKRPFITKAEEEKFHAEVAKLRELVKDPYAALHDLTVSFHCLVSQITDISNSIDDDEDDDKYPLVMQIQEKLRDAERHAEGTDIGMALHDGAWLTKDGWEPASTMPLLQ